MNPGYSTFTGRPKVGRGTFTAKRLAELRAVGNDEEIAFKLHCQNLYDFAAQYIEHGRQLCRSGQKDEARNWYRFFLNSQLLENLAFLPHGRDLAKLREQFNFLHLECHPHDVPSYTNDLASIRHCLTEILSHVEKNVRKTETVRRNGSGRAVRRLHGLGQPQSKHFERGVIPPQTQALPSPA